MQLRPSIKSVTGTGVMGAQPVQQQMAVTKMADRSQSPDAREHFVLMQWIIFVSSCKGFEQLMDTPCHGSPQNRQRFNDVIPSMSNCRQG